MYSIFLILSFFSFSLQAATKTSSAVYYNYADFKSGTEYTPRTINTTKYNSSDPCVTMMDLIAFHYTDSVSNQDNSGNVTPDNFCYGILDYNITRIDFFNIIQMNRNAFQNYRKFVPLYLFYNYIQYSVMDDGCIGYLRLISCYNEFPACVDNGNGKFTVNGICNKICNKYKIRCADFYFSEFCEKKSGGKYCPGSGSDNAWYQQVNYKLLLMTITIVLNLW